MMRHGFEPVQRNTSERLEPAAALVLATHRRWLTAPALVVLFVAGTLGWFLPNGFSQQMRNCQEVCCGRDVDRSAVRASVAVSGLVVAAMLVATDLVRHRRSARSSSVTS
jgi:hypothetical protein